MQALPHHLFVALLARACNLPSQVVKRSAVVVEQVQAESAAIFSLAIVAELTVDSRMTSARLFASFG